MTTKMVGRRWLEQRIRLLITMMRGRIALLCAVMTLHFCAVALSFDGAKVEFLLAKNHIPASSVGIIIVEGNHKIYALNDFKQFKPASLTKIITGAAALELMGAGYQFRTALLYEGSFSKDTFEGVLYLKAGGDPSFASSKLQTLAAPLIKRGIKNIHADLIVDDSVFYTIRDEDWQSKISALDPKMFPLFLNIDPPSGLAPSSAQWREQERTYRKMINLEGKFVVYENVTEPDLWTAYRFKELLSKKGIDLEGNLVHGKTPEKAKTLSEVTTPLPSIVSRMLKTSNNYYADMLVRNLPLRFGEPRANFSDGLEFIKYYLDYVQIANAEYSLNSGSGFSHRNRITPRAFIKLLNHLQNAPSAGGIFLQSLPVAGVDGTLSHRMVRSIARGRIHAKTGYLRPVLSNTSILSGAVGLAGYVFRLDGKTWTFVMIYNGLANPDLIRRMFDEICAQMLAEPQTFTAEKRGPAL